MIKVRFSCTGFSGVRLSREWLVHVLLWSLLVLLASPVTHAEHLAPPQDSTPLDYGQVGYGSLTGPIDRLRQRYLERLLADARAQKLDTVILHIDTDGGAVNHAREMFKMVLDQARDGPRMIALIDFRAISAGAMVSYAHEEIYISPSASIGDIGVIFISKEGEIKYAPEKIETVVRSMLTQAAEQRGWDKALLLKMTARTQKLYHVTLPDGTTQYVIEDDLPRLLAAHPKIDKEDPKQVWVYRGEDRLLTLTGKEAVDLNMATGHAEDADDLYQQLGIEAADVVDLQPHYTERTAWFLATFAPGLAGLAFLFLLFEFKTPGVGLWALLALICAAAFGLSQYYLELAENFEFVLMLIGVALIAAEVFLGLSGGLLALAGGGFAFVGLILSFVPNELEFDFADERFQQALKEAAISALIAVSVTTVGLVLALRALVSKEVQHNFVVTAEIGGTAAGQLADELTQIVGRHGVARDLLRPSGTVSVAGRDYSARAAQGTFIAKGGSVEVIGVEFGELLVRRAETG